MVRQKGMKKSDSAIGIQSVFHLQEDFIMVCV